jgi:hypothetical protein
VFINDRGQVLNDGSMLHNGVGQGVGSALLGAPSRLDPGYWQPYIDSKGRTCVELRTGRLSVNEKGKITPEKKIHTVRELRARGWDNPVWNAAALRKDQWIQLQERVVMATRLRLNAWNDLMTAAPIGGFNAWAKLTYEYQATNDPGEAVKDMDALAPGRNDRPLFSLMSMPLPITHSDFFFSDRELEVSRNGGIPLNTRVAEAGGRRVAELVEKTVVGIVPGMTFGPTSATDSRYTGTSAEYGYTNFPYRVTKTNLTTPTGSNPDAILSDVIAMTEIMYTNGFFGPFVLYHSTGYSQYLNNDYFRSGGTSVLQSVRQRLMQLEGISKIQRLDYLTTNFQFILVQLDPEWVGAINGMPVNVVAWDEKGGLAHHYKVMGIMVPILFAPFNGIAPIVHGTNF